MKNVLIVAYYFPPSGGPGVQRVLKLVKYLPRFGWRPVVLTVANGDYPARDESLLREVSPDVPVYRTTIVEPYGVYRALTGKKKGATVDVNVIPARGQKRPITERVAAWIRATVFIPDARIGWRLTAVREGMRIIDAEKIDAIYSSSPPHTCAIIARALKRRSKLPWVAGFRDPWTGFENTPDRWALPHAIDTYLEGSVCKEADVIDVAWRGIQTALTSAHPEIPASKFVHLANGFDSEDYPAATPAPHDRFTLTYTGSMYGTRNPRDILRAVERLVADGVIDPTKFVLKFVGRFGAEVERMISATTIRASIEVIPYLPHGESIAALLASDALLIIVDEIAGSSDVVPGKVYEYLGAGKPIIAIADPHGAIAELLRETGAGETAAHGDDSEIARLFLQAYHAFLSGTRLQAADPAAVRAYDRKETARRLAAIFDQLTTHDPSEHHG